MAKAFLDTNILIYALDKSNRTKHKLARELLQQHVENQTGVISTQVLQEFYVISTKKLGIPPLTAKALLHGFNKFETLSIHADLIENAIDCSVINKISFWDSLIVVSAEASRCSTLLTEDLNHNQIIRGVRIENPFL